MDFTNNELQLDNQSFGRSIKTLEVIGGKVTPSLST